MNKEQVFSMVKEYCKQHHAERKYCEGDYIPYAGRVFDEKEIVNLVDSALDFWLTSGKYTNRFEEKLAQFLNLPYCSLVNSGSSANLLAVMALTSPLLKERRLCNGDEVITVAAAFPTTVAPIIQAGAVPVFVDIKLPSCNIDVEKLEAAHSKKTKAVFLAHTMGNPFDLDEVYEFCCKHDLWLIEDNCDSLGARYQLRGSGGQWSYTGTVGHIGTSSFYPAHHLTMGEGGAVYTRDPLLNKIVRSLRDWGRDCTCEAGQDNRCNHRFDGQYGTLPFGYDHKYVYSHLGYNLKATDMQGAVGCAQIEKLPDFIAARKSNWNWLRKSLDDLKEYLLLPEKDEKCDPSWFGFLMTVKPESTKSRNEIVSYLEKRNIQTRTLFAGNITRHPCFMCLTEEVDFRICGELTVTDQVMQNSFWIGVYPGMTQEMLQQMSFILHEAFGVNG